MVSKDRGARWSEATSPATYPAASFGGIVSFAPDDAETMYFGHLQLWKSTNGGVTWVSNPTAPHADISSVVFDASKRVIVGSDGGIARLDATKWTSLNKSLDITQAYSVSAHPTWASIVAAGTQDTGTVELLGPLGWHELTSSDGGDVAFDAPAGITYSETQWSGGSYSFYRCFRPSGSSTSSGCSQRTAGLDKSEAAAFVPRFTIDAQSPATLWLCASNLYRTDNRGDLWTPIVKAPSGFFTSVAVAPSNSAVIYAGTSGGKVLVSTDRGATWESRTPSANGPSGSSVEDVAISPSDPAQAFVAKGTHVFRTTDSGKTWSDITVGLPGAPVNTLAIEFDAVPFRLYAGTDIGVYCATDGASISWTYFNDGMPPVVVNRLSYSNNTGTLLAATYGRGIWAISTRFSR
jgi:photosystem II stability/assembly factor-like uncharacterized protein